MNHDEGCNGEGCWFPPDFFQEALHHIYVVNVPYNPMKDYYNINLPIREDQKIRHYDDGFWVCRVGSDLYADRPRYFDRRRGPSGPRSRGLLGRLVDWILARRSRTGTAR